MHGRTRTQNSSRKTKCSVYVLLLLLLVILFMGNNYSFIHFAPGSSMLAGKASSETTPVTFPPECTTEQKSLSAKVRPMRDTACPEATWLLDEKEEEKSTTAAKTSLVDYPILFEPSHGRNPLAIYIGCNKGIDAVDSLRFLSQNPLYDKSTYLEALNLGPMARGVCGAGDAPQSSIYPDKHKPRPAILHCVEAMPATFERVSQAAKKLQWEESFIVHHAAASDSDGIIMFPNVANKPGYESMGLEDCQARPQICQNVTLYTLDRFFSEKVKQSQKNRNDMSIVDYLSIDVEGFDSAVLRGGKDTLEKTKYVEFEVHSKGDWTNVPLSDVISSLREQNFCCYYAGTEGRLWRLTDCMTGPGAKIFSNVACVNVKLAPHLAQHMEEVFLKTIENY